MKKTLLLLGLCGLRLAASQSAVLVPGRTGTFTFPSVAPFTSMGAYRIEARLHGFPAPSTYSIIWAVNDWGNAARLVFRPGLICYENWKDSISWGGEHCISTSALSSDIVIRAQRNPSSMFVSFEVWDVGTGTRHVRTCADGSEYCVITSLGATSFAVTGQIGDTSTTANVAWIKLHSTNVVLNSRPPLQSDAADLADWRFESGLTDTSSYGTTISMSGAAYTATPSYNPVCYAGVQSSFRIGVVSALDGTSSYPLDDGEGLTYYWTQTAGDTVTWTDQNIAHATVTMPSFGSYTYQLQVTDGSANSATCSVKHGAVNADANGVVTLPSSDLTKLFGPMIQFRKSPWPYYDQRHLELADFFGGLQASDYLDIWNTAQTGTISVTNGSTAVTGSGTALATAFCGGGVSPVGTPSIIVWYPVAGGGYGRRSYPVASCTNETHITLGRSWVTTAGTTAGLSFAKWTDAQVAVWVGSSTNANYYDNVMSFYALYYRSGIDTYRDYARTLADRWWTMPFVDQGRTCGTAYPPEGDDCPDPRRKSQTGLVLRALDGRSDMWPGLRSWWDVERAQIVSTSKPTDIREHGYSLWNVSMCAAIDPDASHKAACAADVVTALANHWTPWRESDGIWTNITYNPAPWANGEPGTASVVHGSTTITGSGTNWQSSWFGGVARTMWIKNTPTPAPTSYADGDPVYYTVTYVSPTQVTLDRPYEGTTRTGTGWQIGGVDTDVVGLGTQPFMAGILGRAFQLAYLATGSTTAKGYTTDIANWLASTGYRPSTKGLYYARTFMPCEPTPEGLSGCGPSGVENSRFLSGEIQGLMSNAYQNGASVLSAGDTMHGAMYGKLGGPSSDAIWITELDAFTTDNKKAKNFGFHFGFGAGWSWPAARLGAGSSTSGTALGGHVRFGGKAVIR